MFAPFARWFLVDYTCKEPVMVDALHVLNSLVPLRQRRKTSSTAEIAAIHSDQIFNDDH